MGNTTAPTLKMQSSILGRSFAHDGRPVDQRRAMLSFTVDATKSLIQAICASCNITVGGSGNLVGAFPPLQPLGYHGGGSRTHALFGGSIPIDAGANPLALATDQRGFARVVGAAADMGAYEWSGAPVYNPAFAYFVTPGGLLQIVDMATNTNLATVAGRQQPLCSHSKSLQHACLRVQLRRQHRVVH